MCWPQDTVAEMAKDIARRKGSSAEADDLYRFIKKVCVTCGACRPLNSEGGRQPLLYHHQRSAWRARCAASSPHTCAFSNSVHLHGRWVLRCKRVWCMRCRGPLVLAGSACPCHSHAFPACARAEPAL